MTVWCEGVAEFGENSVSCFHLFDAGDIFRAGGAKSVSGKSVGEGFCAEFFGIGFGLAEVSGDCAELLACGGDGLGGME